MNLLSNAVKFARPDTAPPSRSKPTRLDRWRISVTDNGISVDADRQHSIFVLFTRADKRVPGSGTGLATVKRSIDAHGGRVGMDSAAGGGTTVWFELPGSSPGGRCSRGSEPASHGDSEV